MIKAATIVAVFILSACNTSSTIKSFTPINPDEGQAAIYIYRPSVMANALYSPDIYINDEFKISISNGNYSRITMPAGNYNVQLDADNNQSQDTMVSVSLKSESIYYLRVTTSLKIKNATEYEPYQRQFNLQEVTVETAESEIAQCCSNERNQVVGDTKKEAIDNDGFSVDKTKNPFKN